MHFNRVFKYEKLDISKFEAQFCCCVVFVVLLLKKWAFQNLSGSKTFSKTMVVISVLKCCHSSKFWSEISKVSHHVVQNTKAAMFLVMENPTLDPKPKAALPEPRIESSKKSSPSLRIEGGGNNTRTALVCFGSPSSVLFLFFPLK